MVPRGPLWQYAPYAIKVHTGRTAVMMEPEVAIATSQVCALPALDSDYVSRSNRE